MKRNDHWVLLAVCAAVLSGCATGKVEQVKMALPPNQITKADSIYIKDFDGTKTVFKGDYSDVADKVATERGRIPVIIAEETIARLTKTGYIAKKYSPEAQGNAIVVDGEVLLVDRGSAAARFWVGMGAGNSTIRANVRVFRANDPGKCMAELQMAGTSGGAGGFSGYSDWTAQNSKDLGTKLADYLMGKK